MADEIDEIQEYLYYSSVMNLVIEAVTNIDDVCDEFNNFDELDEEDDAFEQLDDPSKDKQWEQFYNFDERESTEADILQCVVNMIEIEHMMNSTPKKRRKGNRRWGVHPLNQMRREHGHFDNLFEEMLIHDHEKFFNFTRMTPERFDHLLELIRPHITKNAPNAIPAKCRLLITLRFLATGDSLKSLHYNFRVGISTSYNIICETCEVLWNVLQPIYLKYPEQEDWLQISEDFRDKLNFPHCAGAIDGKLIETFAPNNSGSMYYNYLKYFSTNLLAICDAHKNFVYVDIGSYGKQSDGGVLFYSTFGKRLDMNQLNFPPPTPLPYTSTSFPYFIIGDSAFPLKDNLLTPYAGNYLNLTEIEANYNKEQSSVRKVIENTFAIFVRRWQIFNGPIQMQPKNVEKIIKAAVVLHNYIKSFDDIASIRYMREERCNYSTSQGLCSFYESGLRLRTANSSENASAARNTYAIYLKNVL